MMGWRAAFSSLLFCGGALCRPSLLGAAQGFPFHATHQNQRHHGHASHSHHRQGHSLEVSPLDGLYGAPAELPSYGVEELSGYNIPAASAPNPSVAAPSMMMDPSYYFEYKSADSERTEDADSTGSITGNYGYKTAGGNDILVKYSAGADTGFVIENMEELAAALEKSAAEAVLVKAKPYTWETVAVNYVWPNVDAASMVQDSSYSYGYKGSDHAQDEESDAAGNVRGSYSFKTADGQDFEVKYTSGVGGFVVENLEELLAQSNPQSAEYAAVVAEQAALASGHSVVATRGNSLNAAVAEMYVHKEIEAEPYLHQEIEAEPYVHEEFEAEPYQDEQVPYVHDEIVAEPYIHDDGSSASGVAASKKAETPAASSYSASPLPLPGYETSSRTHNIDFPTSNTQSVAQHVGQGVMDQSFMFNAIGEDHEFEETADVAGERTGSYSYVNPEGDNILVKYTAGKNGFVILNPREVLPQAPVA